MSRASQESTRRRERAAARLPLSGANGALKSRVCALIDRDDNFANRLRQMMDEYEAEGHGSGHAEHREEDDGVVAKARVDVVQETTAGTCTFTFVAAAYLRSLPADAEPLPAFQQLREEPGTLVQRTLDAGEAYRGAYASELLAVSHRWERPEAPDTQGEQQRAVCAHVRAHPEIRAVWYDVRDGASNSQPWQSAGCRCSQPRVCPVSTNLPCSGAPCSGAP